MHTFMLTLISTERATNIGIYLNSKDYILEEKDRTPICKLNIRLGIYLVKQDKSTNIGRYIVNYITTTPITTLSISYLPLTSTLYTLYTIL